MEEKSSKKSSCEPGGKVMKRRGNLFKWMNKRSHFGIVKGGGIRCWEVLNGKDALVKTGEINVQITSI